MDLSRLENSFFEGKRPSPPLFIVTYGPPGSGKSAIVKDLLKQLSISQDRVISVLVDEVVERIPGYSDAISKASATIDPDQRQQQLNEVYFRFRRDYADILSESILHRAFVGKYHVVWETTGLDLSWALKTIQDARHESYMIVLVYPVVTEEKLLARVEQRSRTGSNPRQPDSKRIIANVIAAQKNFATIAGYVDRAIVFDNDQNPEDLRVMVDIQKEYQGWCSQEQKNCKQGVITKSTCDRRSLNALRKHFETSYAEYLDQICGP